MTQIGRSRRLGATAPHEHRRGGRRAHLLLQVRPPRLRRTSPTTCAQSGASAHRPVAGADSGRLTRASTCRRRRPRRRGKGPTSEGGLGSGRLPHRSAAQGSPATGGGSREPSARRGCGVPSGARRHRTTSTHRDTVVGLVRTLLGDLEDHALSGSAAGLRRRAREPAGASSRTETAGVMFTARVLSGNLRLLIGMIRANQPWKLAIGLSRALTAALAAGVFALVTPDIWQLGDALGWIRLSAIGVGSVAAITVALIVGVLACGSTRRIRSVESRWPSSTWLPRQRSCWVCFLYVALLLLALLTSPVLVPSELFEEGLGQAVGVGAHMKLAWLTSLARDAGWGARGRGLESDESVRAAAYTYRQDRVRAHGWVSSACQRRPQHRGSRALGVRRSHLTDGRGYTLHRAAAHVTNRRDAGKARLVHPRTGLPSGGRLASRHRGCRPLSSAGPGTPQGRQTSATRSAIVDPPNFPPHSSGHRPAATRLERFTRRFCHGSGHGCPICPILSRLAPSQGGR